MDFLMTFFNKKTDVMDIELTPYGRYLLSIGKLKPKYYEFSDDDVLYDVSASAQLTTEIQENTHDRIVNQTPKLKTLYLKKSPHQDSDFNYGQTGSVDIRIDEIREEFEDVSHNQKGIYALGRSSYSSDKTPGFQMTMLRGEISSSLNYLSASSGVVDSLQIPQIEYEYLITKSTGSQILDSSDNYDFTSNIRPDGTYDKLQFEIPIAHFKEFNSFYEKENFEIEVFMIMEGSYSNGQVREQLFPLKFSKESNAIVNDMLVDERINDFSQFEEIGDSAELAPDYVEHYFKIEVDREIPEEELCKVVDSLDINDQFIDEELICPDQRTERFDIYASRVGPEDLEDCD